MLPAHWEDLDFQQTLWRCQPERTKLREWKKRDRRPPAHLVSLPALAIEILRDLLSLNEKSSAGTRMAGYRTAAAGDLG